MDEIHVTLNKNSVAGDKSAVVPGGIRIGTPALTTRGLVESDFEKVADFIHRGIQITIDCKNKTPAPGKLKASLGAAGAPAWSWTGERPAGGFGVSSLPQDVRG